ncbi:phosphatase PAP2 family protein [Flexivirga caeni]|uniref:Inositol phosphorylceramide synthase n=1 Tax=Flexivirga caeni TaxID=2294115 RepID=A0A3M9MJI5_9MICO|nr:phosphatase PAP2 family protein [Flexivirga caeni]RNI24818.1 inositol phosphorylceramide synthase [Flexivirga caeni]
MTARPPTTVTVSSAEGRPAILILLVAVFLGGARLLLARHRIADTTAPAHNSDTPTMPQTRNTDRPAHWPVTPRMPPSWSHRAVRRWPLEVVILVGIDAAYESLRNLVPDQHTRGVHLATAVNTVQRSLHWNLDLRLNHELGAHPLPAHLAEDYYSWLFLPVTVIVLAWVFWRHPHSYRRARTALVVITLVALTCFYLYPMAPPRLLPGSGFIDISHLYPTWGSWSTPTVADTSNQYAAMPSLHCAWALWNGLVIAALARRRWVRALAMTYPALTYLAVIATANHFTIDAVAGLVTTAAVFAVIDAPAHRMIRRIPQHISR